ncbi:transmembrane protein 272-like [Limanda limanda]|uniref:transmembrane protein 272-like n=1 Tax=Limanda limanda TaxID=27771 RepID=UPI0029C957C7|nr:transmembrane protein 272-like [Limanda limanda]
MSRFVVRIHRPPQLKGAALVLSKLFGCAIPVVQIAIGSVYLDDCPVQHYIPIYLIVSGVFGLMLALFTCIPFPKEPEDNDTDVIDVVCITWNSLLAFFLFSWFIVGNVWIYSIYQPEYTKNSTNVDVYCDKTLYLFSFWITTLFYIIFGFVLVAGCCRLVCAYLCCPDDDANANANVNVNVNTNANSNVNVKANAKANANVNANVNTNVIINV